LVNFDCTSQNPRFCFGSKFVDICSTNLNIIRMKLKDLLLARNSFAELLKQFSIAADDIKIQNEDVLLSDQHLQHQQILKESICIEGKNNDGFVNFFGTLHYNILEQLAVFEVLDFERTPNTIDLRVA